MTRERNGDELAWLLDKVPDIDYRIYLSWCRNAYGK